MFVFKDISLKFKSNVRFEFGKIYGIGYQKSAYLADFIGLGQRFFINNLNYYLFEIFNIIFKIFYITDDRLKFLIRQQMIKLFEIKSVKGVRFSRGLPIRGQRTHSNSKQTKYYKKNEI